MCFSMFCLLNLIIYPRDVVQNETDSVLNEAARPLLETQTVNFCLKSEFAGNHYFPLVSQCSPCAVGFSSSSSRAHLILLKAECSCFNTGSKLSSTGLASKCVSCNWIRCAGVAAEQKPAGREKVLFLQSIRTTRCYNGHLLIWINTSFLLFDSSRGNHKAPNPISLVFFSTLKPVCVCCCLLQGSTPCGIWWTVCPAAAPRCCRTTRWRRSAARCTRSPAATWRTPKL